MTVPLEPWSVVVAGGGPAGFMAAIAAAEAGVERVLILEASPEPLGKVLISGGGRCNVTHGCWDPRSLVGHYPRGSRALRGPFSRFATGDVVAWFDDHGLELVEEADGRLFPRSNRSTSVIACLRRAAEAAGVQLWTGAALHRAVLLEDGLFRLHFRGSRQGSTTPDDGLLAQRLVLATGSHPSGRQLAQAFGHTLVPPVPSLFSLTLQPHGLASLAGVAMDPVALELEVQADPAGPVQRHRQQGAVLITHRGLSGPALLRLSAFAARDLHRAAYRARLRVDWSGGRSQADLEALFGELRRDQGRRQLINARPWPSLSRRLWAQLLADQGVESDRRWSELARRQQEALILALRASRYGVVGRGPFGEEFVTAGGVALGEVELARMESRLVPGCYLVGELLDVDGVTGGFNFQHCWSSGWLAGQALAARS